MLAHLKIIIHDHSWHRSPHPFHGPLCASNSLFAQYFQTITPLHKSVGDDDDDDYDYDDDDDDDGDDGDDDDFDDEDNENYVANL